MDVTQMEGVGVKGKGGGGGGGGVGGGGNGGGFTSNLTTMEQSLRSSYADIAFGRNSPCPGISGTLPGEEAREQGDLEEQFTRLENPLLRGDGTGAGEVFTADTVESGNAVGGGGGGAGESRPSRPIRQNKQQHQQQESQKFNKQQQQPAPGMMMGSAYDQEKGRPTARRKRRPYEGSKSARGLLLRDTPKEQQQQYQSGSGVGGGSYSAAPERPVSCSPTRRVKGVESSCSVVVTGDREAPVPRPSSVDLIAMDDSAIGMSNNKLESSRSISSSLWSNDGRCPSYAEVFFGGGGGGGQHSTSRSLDSLSNVEQMPEDNVPVQLVSPEEEASASFGEPTADLLKQQVAEIVTFVEEASSQLARDEEIMEQQQQQQQSGIISVPQEVAACQCPMQQQFEQPQQHHQMSQVCPMELELHQDMSHMAPTQMDLHGAHQLHGMHNMDTLIQEFNNEMQAVVYEQQCQQQQQSPPPQHIIQQQQQSPPPRHIIQQQQQSPPPRHVLQQQQQSPPPRHIIQQQQQSPPPQHIHHQPHPSPPRKNIQLQQSQPATSSQEDSSTKLSYASILAVNMPEKPLEMEEQSSRSSRRKRAPSPPLYSEGLSEPIILLPHSEPGGGDAAQDTEGDVRESALDSEIVFKHPTIPGLIFKKESANLLAPSPMPRRRRRRSGRSRSKSLHTSEADDDSDDDEESKNIAELSATGGSVDQQRQVKESSPAAAGAVAQGGKPTRPSRKRKPKSKQLQKTVSESDIPESPRHQHYLDHHEPPTHDTSVDDIEIPDELAYGEDGENSESQSRSCDVGYVSGSGGPTTIATQPSEDRDLSRARSETPSEITREGFADVETDAAPISELSSSHQKAVHKKKKKPKKKLPHEEEDEIEKALRDIEKMEQQQQQQQGNRKQPTATSSSAATAAGTGPASLYKGASLDTAPSFDDSEMSYGKVEMPGESAAPASVPEEILAEAAQVQDQQQSPKPERRQRKGKKKQQREMLEETGGSSLDLAAEESSLPQSAGGSSSSTVVVEHVDILSEALLETYEKLDSGSPTTRDAVPAELLTLEEDQQQNKDFNEEQAAVAVTTAPVATKRTKKNKKADKKEKVDESAAAAVVKSAQEQPSGIQAVDIQALLPEAAAPPPVVQGEQQEDQDKEETGEMKEEKVEKQLVEPVPSDADIGGREEENAPLITLVDEDQHVNVDTITTTSAVTGEPEIGYQLSKSERLDEFPMTVISPEPQKEVINNNNSNAVDDTLSRNITGPGMEEQTKNEPVNETESATAPTAAAVAIMTPEESSNQESEQPRQKAPKRKKRKSKKSESESIDECSPLLQQQQPPSQMDLLASSEPVVEKAPSPPPAQAEKQPEQVPTAPTTTVIEKEQPKQVESFGLLKGAVDDHLFDAWMDDDICPIEDDFEESQPVLADSKPIESATVESVVSSESLVGVQEQSQVAPSVVPPSETEQPKKTETFGLLKGVNDDHLFDAWMDDDVCPIEDDFEESQPVAVALSSDKPTEVIPAIIPSAQEQPETLVSAVPVEKEQQQQQQETKQFGLVKGDDDLFDAWMNDDICPIEDDFEESQPAQPIIEPVAGEAMILDDEPIAPIIQEQVVQQQEQQQETVQVSEQALLPAVAQVVPITSNEISAEPRQFGLLKSDDDIDFWMNDEPCPIEDDDEQETAVIDPMVEQMKLFAPDSVKEEKGVDELLLVLKQPDPEPVLAVTGDQPAIQAADKDADKPVVVAEEKKEEKSAGGFNLLKSSDPWDDLWMDDEPCPILDDEDEAEKDQMVAASIEASLPIPNESIQLDEQEKQTAVSRGEEAQVQSMVSPDAEKSSQQSEILEECEQKQEQKESSGDHDQTAAPASAITTFTDGEINKASGKRSSKEKKKGNKGGKSGESKVEKDAATAEMTSESGKSSKGGSRKVATGGSSGSSSLSKQKQKGMPKLASSEWKSKVTAAAVATEELSSGQDQESSAGEWETVGEEIIEPTATSTTSTSIVTSTPAQSSLLEASTVSVVPDIMEVVETLVQPAEETVEFIVQQHEEEKSEEKKVEAPILAEEATGAAEEIPETKEEGSSSADILARPEKPIKRRDTKKKLKRPAFVVETASQAENKETMGEVEENTGAVESKEVIIELSSTEDSQQPEIAIKAELDNDNIDQTAAPAIVTAELIDAASGAATATAEVKNKGGDDDKETKIIDDSTTAAVANIIIDEGQSKQDDDEQSKSVEEIGHKGDKTDKAECSKPQQSGVGKGGKKGDNNNKANRNKGKGKGKQDKMEEIIASEKADVPEAAAAIDPIAQKHKKQRRRTKSRNSESDVEGGGVASDVVVAATEEQASVIHSELQISAIPEISGQIQQQQQQEELEFTNEPAKAKGKQKRQRTKSKNSESENQMEMVQKSSVEIEETSPIADELEFSMEPVKGNKGNKGRRRRTKSKNSESEDQFVEAAAQPPQVPEVVEAAKTDASLSDSQVLATSEPVVVMAPTEELEFASEPAAAKGKGKLKRKRTKSKNSESEEVVAAVEAVIPQEKLEQPLKEHEPTEVSSLPPTSLSTKEAPPSVTTTTELEFELSAQPKENKWKGKQQQRRKQKPQKSRNSESESDSQSTSLQTPQSETPVQPSAVVSAAQVAQETVPKAVESSVAQAEVVTHSAPIPTTVEPQPKPKARQQKRKRTQSKNSESEDVSSAAEPKVQENSSLEITAEEPKPPKEEKVSSALESETTPPCPVADTTIEQVVEAEQKESDPVTTASADEQEATTLPTTTTASKTPKVADVDSSDAATKQRNKAKQKRKRNKTRNSECEQDETVEPVSVVPGKSPETEQKPQLAEQTVVSSAAEADEFIQAVSQQTAAATEQKEATAENESDSLSSSTCLNQDESQQSKSSSALSSSSKGKGRKKKPYSDSSRSQSFCVSSGDHSHQQQQYDDSQKSSRSHSVAEFAISGAVVISAAAAIDLSAEASASPTAPIQVEEEKGKVESIPVATETASPISQVEDKQVVEESKSTQNKEDDDAQKVVRSQVIVEGEPLLPTLPAAAVPVEQTDSKQDETRGKIKADYKLKTDDVFGDAWMDDDVCPFGDEEDIGKNSNNDNEQSVGLVVTTTTTTEEATVAAQVEEQTTKKEDKEEQNNENKIESDIAPVVVDVPVPTDTTASTTTAESNKPTSFALKTDEIFGDAWMDESAMVIDVSDGDAGDDGIKEKTVDTKSPESTPITFAKVVALSQPPLPSPPAVAAVEQPSVVSVVVLEDKIESQLEKQPEVTADVAAEQEADASTNPAVANVAKEEKRVRFPPDEELSEERPFSTKEGKGGRKKKRKPQKSKAAEEAEKTLASLEGHSSMDEGSAQSHDESHTDPESGADDDGFMVFQSRKTKLMRKRGERQDEDEEEEPKEGEEKEVEPLSVEGQETSVAPLAQPESPEKSVGEQDSKISLPLAVAAAEAVQVAEEVTVTSSEQAVAKEGELNSSRGGDDDELKSEELESWMTVSDYAEPTLTHAAQDMEALLAGEVDSVQPSPSIETPEPVKPILKTEETTSTTLSSKEEEEEKKNLPESSSVSFAKDVIIIQYDDEEEPSTVSFASLREYSNKPMPEDGKDVRAPPPLQESFSMEESPPDTPIQTSAPVEEPQEQLPQEVPQQIAETPHKGEQVEQVSVATPSPAPQEDETASVTTLAPVASAEEPKTIIQPTTLHAMSSQIISQLEFQEAESRWHAYISQQRNRQQKPDATPQEIGGQQEKPIAKPLENVTEAIKLENEAKTAKSIEMTEAVEVEQSEETPVAVVLDASLPPPSPPPAATVQSQSTTPPSKPLSYAQAAAASPQKTQKQASLAQNLEALLETARITQYLAFQEAERTYHEYRAHQPSPTNENPQEEEKPIIKHEQIPESHVANVPESEPVLPPKADAEITTTSNKSRPLVEAAQEVSKMVEQLASEIKALSVSSPPPSPSSDQPHETTKLQTTGTTATPPPSPEIPKVKQSTTSKSEPTSPQLNDSQQDPFLLQMVAFNEAERKWREGLDKQKQQQAQSETDEAASDGPDGPGGPGSSNQDPPPDGGGGGRGRRGDKPPVTELLLGGLSNLSCNWLDWSTYLSPEVKLPEKLTFPTSASPSARNANKAPHFPTPEEMAVDSREVRGDDVEIELSSDLVAATTTTTTKVEQGLVVDVEDDLKKIKEESKADVDELGKAINAAAEKLSNLDPEQLEQTLHKTWELLGGLKDLEGSGFTLKDSLDSSNFPAEDPDASSLSTELKELLSKLVVLMAQTEKLNKATKVNESVDDDDNNFPKGEETRKSASSYLSIASPSHPLSDDENGRRSPEGSAAASTTSPTTTTLTNSTTTSLVNSSTGNNGFVEGARQDKMGSTENLKNWFGGPGEEKDGQHQHFSSQGNKLFTHQCGCCGAPILISILNPLGDFTQQQQHLLRDNFYRIPQPTAGHHQYHHHHHHHLQQDGVFH